MSVGSVNGSTRGPRYYSGMDEAVTVPSSVTVPETHMNL
jgi:hypothetical protein